KILEQIAQQYQEVQIPEVVKNFILFFHRNILENNVHELQSIYEQSFNKLTEKFYAQEPWPEADAISPLVNDGKDIVNFIISNEKNFIFFFSRSHYYDYYRYYNNY